ncbi:MAG: hypothetical protein J7K23_04200 [Thermoproteales archaeon]|nr:hypothetical protein [Thermoproteales archaeon]
MRGHKARVLAVLTVHYKPSLVETTFSKKGFTQVAVAVVSVVFIIAAVIIGLYISSNIYENVNITDSTANESAQSLYQGLIGALDWTKIIVIVGFATIVLGLLWKMFVARG